MSKPIDPMEAAAEDVAEVLKALANPRRLRILCALVQGRMSVGALENALGASQSYVSGQLLKLRGEGLVNCEKEGRVVYYYLSDPRVKPVIERLYEVFCPVEVSQTDGPSS